MLIKLNRLTALVLLLLSLQSFHLLDFLLMPRILPPRLCSFCPWPQEKGQVRSFTPHRVWFLKTPPPQSQARHIFMSPQGLGTLPWGSGGLRSGSLGRDIMNDRSQLSFRGSTQADRIQGQNRDRIQEPAKGSLGWTMKKT